MWIHETDEGYLDGQDSGCEEAAGFQCANLSFHELLLVARGRTISLNYKFPLLWDYLMNLKKKHEMLWAGERSEAEWQVWGCCSQAMFAENGWR